MELVVTASLFFLFGVLLVVARALVLSVRDAVRMIRSHVDGSSDRRFRVESLDDRLSRVERSLSHE